MWKIDIMVELQYNGKKKCLIVLATVLNKILLALKMFGNLHDSLDYEMLVECASGLFLHLGRLFFLRFEKWWEYGNKTSSPDHDISKEGHCVCVPW